MSVSTGAARISPVLLKEVAERANVRYHTAYRGQGVGVSSSCLGIESNLRGMQRLEAEMRAVQTQRQQQGDLAGFLELRELLGVMDRFRCDYINNVSVYYWPHISVR